MDKARHAFGALENIDSALSANKIDSYDILFVKDANGKPFVGWIDKDGNKVIVDDSAEFAALESKLETKADSSDIEALQSQITSKADASDVTELEKEVETKVDVATVQSMISEAAVGVIEVVEF